MDTCLYASPPTQILTCLFHVVIKEAICEKSNSAETMQCLFFLKKTKQNILHFKKIFFIYLKQLKFSIRACHNIGILAPVKMRVVYG